MDISLSVVKFDSNNNNAITHLHDFIETFEEADLLAQLEMTRKSDGELIGLFTGWNRGINKNELILKKALDIEQKYKKQQEEFDLIMLKNKERKTTDDSRWRF